MARTVAESVKAGADLEELVAAVKEHRVLRSGQLARAKAKRKATRAARRKNR